MKQCDHVVFNGDMFELFYVDPNQINIKPVDKSAPDGMDLRNRVRAAVKESKKWLETFVSENPNVHLHFVMGNHENIRKFRYQLDRLAERYKENFEWDPEGIRIGNALFTHGDLQMDKKTAAERGEWRLRQAAFPESWNRIFSTGYLVGRPIVESAAAINSPVKRVSKYLQSAAKMEEFRVRYKGERKKLDIDDIKHVFFGHTHVKFFDKEIDGKHYYNTGSFTHNPKRIEDVGIIEAELEEGELKNIRLYGKAVGAGR
jgi:predicted phosphodiesterase